MLLLHSNTTSFITWTVLVSETSSIRCAACVVQVHLCTLHFPLYSIIPDFRFVTLTGDISHNTHHLPFNESGEKIKWLQSSWFYLILCKVHCCATQSRKLISTPFLVWHRQLSPDEDQATWHSEKIIWSHKCYETTHNQNKCIHAGNWLCLNIIKCIWQSIE